MAVTERTRLRNRRKTRVRKQLRSVERPLLTVYRSNKHIYACLTDPLSGQTLTSASTRTPSVRSAIQGTGNKEAAKKVGEAIAALAREKQIDRVTFNRNGFVYCGRVKALADAAREAGLKI